jgi:peptide/nickel transport system permease protein
MEGVHLLFFSSLLICDTLSYIEVSPWLVVFPSLAVSVAVFGFNLLGDALRDALDPRLKSLQER